MVLGTVELKHKNSTRSRSTSGRDVAKRVECTDAASIRLPSCSHNQKPSTPLIRRRTCRTHSSVCFSYLFFFFHLNLELNLFLHVVVIGEESGPLAENTLSKVMSPTSSTTTTSQRPLKIFIQESSSDSRPSNSHDLEYDDYIIGMALLSPLFTQEREDAASL